MFFSLLSNAILRSSAHAIFYFNSWAKSLNCKMTLTYLPTYYVYMAPCKWNNEAVFLVDIKLSSSVVAWVLRNPSRLSCWIASSRSDPTKGLEKIQQRWNDWPLLLRTPLAVFHSFTFYKIRPTITVNS